MKTQNKRNNGITLVALVITIIILLILAGISIATLGGENGLVKKAKEAKNNTIDAQKAENAAIDAYNTEIDKTIDGIGGGVTIPRRAYEVGEEVTVGGEDFYVIKPSAETEDTVTLLAKYNLNTAGTEQQNAVYGTTACAFSTDNYWSGETLPTEPPYYNLNNNDAVKNDIGSAVYKANAYARTKGATSGRLLEYEEAISLKETWGDIIWGKDNTQNDGNYLYYWLGSAYYANYVWIVVGRDEGCFDDTFGVANYFGVRPVITISKS